MGWNYQAQLVNAGYFFHQQYFGGRSPQNITQQRWYTPWKSIWFLSWRIIGPENLHRSFPKRLDHFGCIHRPFSESVKAVWCPLGNSPIDLLGTNRKTPLNSKTWTSSKMCIDFLWKPEILSHTLMKKYPCLNHLLPDKSQSCLRPDTSSSTWSQACHFKVCLVSCHFFKLHGFISYVKISADMYIYPQNNAAILYLLPKSSSESF